MTEHSDHIRRQAQRLGYDTPIAVVPPALKTYSATWTIKGGEAEFWQLVSAFTQGLITGACTVVSCKCERTPEQSSIEFTLRAGPSHIKRLTQVALESIEQTGISTGEAEPFNIGPHIRPGHFRHQLGKIVGEKSAILVLDCIMKALIKSQCRLLLAEGGALGGNGAFLDVMIAGTSSQVEIAQTVLARSLD